MPCTEFEDLLVDYARLAPEERRRADAHLQTCPSCRSWLEALAEIDAALISEFEDIHAPVTLATGARQRVAQSLPARVSAVPEILDFVGWLGVICAAGLLAYFLMPVPVPLSTPMLYTVAGILLCLALSATAWALRSNEG